MLQLRRLWGLSHELWAILYPSSKFKLELDTALDELARIHPKYDNRTTLRVHLAHTQPGSESQTNVATIFVTSFFLHLKLG
jgi:hypothetical protein